MRAEVMAYYGLAVTLDQAGYFETAHHQQLMKDIKGAVFEGRIQRWRRKFGQADKWNGRGLGWS